jgi:hypothetical protein
MAGPTSAVLFETIPTEQIWGEIENVIHKISNKVEGNDFWVISTEFINGTIKKTDGRPFGIEKHKIDADYYNFSEEEILMIKNYVGFNPKFNLGIYAMCNSEIDHKILGELTLYLAENYDGLIDFGGQLTNQPNELKGEIWEIPYETSGGMMNVYNVADAEFLRNWLNNENFSMIK